MAFDNTTIIFVMAGAKGIKKQTLKRSKYFFVYKIDMPLPRSFRRKNMPLKQARSKYIIFERMVYYMKQERCAIANEVLITSSN